MIINVYITRKKTRGGLFYYMTSGMGNLGSGFVIITSHD